VVVIFNISVIVPNLSKRDYDTWEAYMLFALLSLIYSIFYNT